MGCLFDLVYFFIWESILAVVPPRTTALLGAIAGVLAVGCWRWATMHHLDGGPVVTAGIVCGIAGAVLLLVAWLAWLRQE
jgi:hypothetical protein